MKISGNYRSPQADKITVNEDGTMKGVIGTMRGISQLKPFDPYREVEAATMARQAGIQVSVKDWKTWVTTRPGSWTTVSGVDFGEKSRSVRVRAASAAGGTIYIVSDSLDGEIAARIEIPAGTEEPKEFTADMNISGQTDVYFVFDSEIEFYAWQAER